jgi:CubicO group peptidase (beta-lactamase class C family)
MRLPATALTFVLLAASAAGETNAPTGAAVPLDSGALATLLEEVRTKHDVPALAAAVVTEDGPVLVEVVGVRKRGERTRAERNDMFHLGSCTKAFTGWLAGWAVENGKLRWDSTLGEVFPLESRRLQDNQKQITLEQLVTHRSGITGDLPKGLDHWPRQSRPVVNGRETMKQRQDFVKALGESPLQTEPGETYAYCNSNQILAAAMIEKTAGKPWEILLEELLFRPLGMKETGQGPMVTRGGPARQPYQHERNGQPTDAAPQADNPEVLGPSGRLHMSLDSWGRFVAEILRGARGKGTLLKQETYNELLKPPGYNRGCWLSQGPDDSGRATRLGHTGSNNVNYCRAEVYPAENFAILVAANQGDSLPGSPGKSACDEIEQRLAQLWRERQVTA